MHIYNEGCCDHHHHHDYHDYHSKCCGRGIAALAGRLVIGLIFLFSVLYTLWQWDAVVADVNALQLPFAQFLVGIGLILQFLGAVSLILGYKTRTGALLLILFMVPVTLIFHSFWLYPESHQMVLIQDFIRGLYYIGALFLIVAFGPGRFSLDAHICCKHCVEDKCCESDNHCH